MNLEETLNIATQLAVALDAAAVRGIVHRDIKPENLHAARGRLARSWILGSRS